MHGLCAHGRDAAWGQAHGQPSEGWTSASSRGPGGIRGPGKQRLAKWREGNPVPDWVRLSLGPYHVKLVTLSESLCGPALGGVPHPPRLGCEYTSLLGFWDCPGCDAERVDISVLTWSSCLPTSAQRKELCGAVLCPSCPLTTFPSDQHGCSS